MKLLKRLWSELPDYGKAFIFALVLILIIGSLILIFSIKEKKKIIKPEIVIEKPIVIPQEKLPVIIPDIKPPIIKPDIIPEPIKEDPCEEYKYLNNKNFEIVKCWKNHYIGFHIMSKTNDVFKMQDFFEKIKTKFKRSLIKAKFYGMKKNKNNAYIYYEFDNRIYYYKEQYEVK